MIKVFSAVFAAAFVGIAFAPSALALQTQIVASGRYLCAIVRGDGTSMFQSSPGRLTGRYSHPALY